MRLLISFASILACTLPVHAQITVALKPSLGGSAELKIRNDGPVALAAYVIAGRQIMGMTKGEMYWPFKKYADSLVDMTAPLASSQERTVMRSGPRSVLEPAFVSAGIFADGTTTGDAALITDLMLRRSSMLLAVETALETLSTAGRHNMPRSLVIQQFRTFADLAKRWYLTPEQQAGWPLYDSVLFKLINLPDRPATSAFPPTGFVDQEGALLTRRRNALEESRPPLEDMTPGPVRK
jgi:hypothetical protein